jgi:hypothetical protein
VPALLAPRRESIRAAVQASDLSHHLPPFLICSEPPLNFANDFILKEARKRGTLASLRLCSLRSLTVDGLDGVSCSLTVDGLDGEKLSRYRVLSLV